MTGMRRPITPDIAQQWRDAAAAGASTSDIAAGPHGHGYSLDTIRTHVANPTLAGRRTRTPITDDEHTRMVELRQRGLSLARIAAAVGRSESAVRDHIGLVEVCAGQPGAMSDDDLGMWVA